MDRPDTTLGSDPNELSDLYPEEDDAEVVLTPLVAATGLLVGLEVVSVLSAFLAVGEAFKFGFDPVTRLFSDPDRPKSTNNYDEILINTSYIDFVYLACVPVVFSFL